jgi:hypothetical protein
VIYSITGIDVGISAKVANRLPEPQLWVFMQVFEESFFGYLVCDFYF